MVPTTVGNLSLELDDRVKTNHCKECGFDYPTVHGFVYEDSEALAVYWAAIYVGHPHHPESRVDLTISIGNDWSEGSVASERRYAQLDIWPAANQVRMGFHDVRGPLVSATFGSPLGRADALASPLREQFFRVADYICYEDPRVSGALGTVSNYQ